MEYEVYSSLATEAARLVESGELEAAVSILIDLVGSDISEVDKLMMALNLAVVMDKMQRIEEAISWYKIGTDYERPHGKYFVAQALACYYAERGRKDESICLLEDILRRSEVTEHDRTILNNNLGILRSGE